MGEILIYTSACGYTTTLDEGAGFAGVNELRVCGTCRELVTVFRPVAPGEPEPRDAPDRCPSCGAAGLTEPRRLDDADAVACPECGDAMTVTPAGMWD